MLVAHLRAGRVGAETEESNQKNDFEKILLQNFLSFWGENDNWRSMIDGIATSLAESLRLFRLPLRIT